MSPQPTSSDRITPMQAAMLLGVTEGTLRNWRSWKQGPAAHHFTKRTSRKGRGSRPRVYYLRSEVETYIKKNGRVTA